MSLTLDNTTMFCTLSDLGSPDNSQVTHLCNAAQIQEIQSICPDVTEEEALKALELCDQRSAKTTFEFSARTCTSDYVFHADSSCLLSFAPLCQRH